MLFQYCPGTVPFSEAVFESSLYRFGRGFPMSLAAPRLRVRSTSYIVIPARLASTRLPRKLLLAETGKTLLEHTYEAASRATRPSGLCVAADHEEIAAAV